MKQEDFKKLVKDVLPALNELASTLCSYKVEGVVDINMKSDEYVSLRLCGKGCEMIRINNDPVRVRFEEEL